MRKEVIPTRRKQLQLEICIEARIMKKVYLPKENIYEKDKKTI